MRDKDNDLQILVWESFKGISLIDASEGNFLMRGKIFLLTKEISHFLLKANRHSLGLEVYAGNLFDLFVHVFKN